jgi:1,4-dihydroxy-2-naphthoyl-CoA hydrolase
MCAYVTNLANALESGALISESYQGRIGYPIRKDTRKQDSPMLWKHEPDVEHLQQSMQGTLLEHLGLTLEGFGDDWVSVRMPVDRRTIQPYGILHGGASVALAESLGSLASALCIEDHSKHAPVGVEINANHLRQVPDGQFVIGTLSPIRIGRRMHVWNIEIRDPEDRLVCISRLTIMIIERD